MMTDTTHYRHDTIPCEELDRLAHLPSVERIAEVGAMFDPLSLLVIAARKAQIHLEMRLEMLRAEEEEQRG